MPKANVIPNGRAVLDARAVCGLTQEELAIRAGYAKRTIERIENGNRTSIDTLSNIADALGVDVSTLHVDNINNRGSIQPKPDCEIEITIDRDFATFTAQEAWCFLQALKELSQIEGRVVIVDKQQGSVLLKLRIARIDAKRVRTATLNEELKSLNVSDVRIVHFDNQADNIRLRLIGQILDGQRAALRKVYEPVIGLIVANFRSHLMRVNRQLISDKKKRAIANRKLFKKPPKYPGFDEIENQHEIIELFSLIGLSKAIDVRSHRHVSAARNVGTDPPVNSDHELAPTVPDEEEDIYELSASIGPDEPKLDKARVIETAVDLTAVEDLLTELSEELSSRTLERIALMQLEGWRNPDIAQELNMPPQTVENHHREILAAISKIYESERAFICR